MGLFDGVVGDRQRQELLLSGLQARATVTGIKSLGRTGPTGVLTEISLQVDPVGRRPFAKTIHEYLPPGVEASLTIGAQVSVRHNGKTIVLESTDGSGTGGGQPAWAPPPAAPAGGWVMPPGQVPVTTTVYETTTTLTGMDAQAIADAVRAAMERVPGFAGTAWPNAQVEAPATIADVTDSASAGGHGGATVRLRVEPPGQPAFDAQLQVHFSSPERRAQVTPGRRLRVVYDPANPALVMIVPNSLQ